MGNNAQSGIGGMGTPGTGGGTMTPMSYGSSPMMPSSGAATPGGGNPFAAQQQAYSQYLAQALPNIQNGIRAGTIQPGQALQNFQGPQAFGLPQGYGGGTSQPMMSGLGAGGHK